MFSCEFCEISKNTFFTEHILATASVSHIKIYWVLLQKKVQDDLEFWKPLFQMFTCLEKRLSHQHRLYIKGWI